MNIAFQILIFVMISMLFILRFVDKRSQTIEKSKHYFDKIKADLDDLVGHKTENLKNIAIEVDVHQKASLEILKKNQAIEKEFVEKNEVFENAFSRIEDYDRALKDLVEMTERVDENLLRLKDESVFVEKISLKLAKFKSEISKIESLIPEIQNNFNVQNAESAEKLLSILESSVQESFVEINEKMDAVKYSVGEFSDFVEYLDSKKLEMEEAATQEFVAGIEDIYRKAEDKFSNLQEEINEDINLIFEKINKESENTDNIFTEKSLKFKTKIDEFTENYKAIESNFTNLIQDADKTLSNGTKNLKMLIDRSDLASVKLNENFDKISGLNNEFEGFSVLANEFDSKFAEYSQILSDVEKHIKQINTNSDKLNHLNKEFNVLENKVPKLLENFAQKDKEILEDVAANLQVNIEKEFEKLSKDVNVASQLANDYCTKISRAYIQSDKDVETLSAKLQNEIQDLVQSAQNEKGILENTLSELNEKVESIFVTKIQGFEKEIDSKVGLGTSNFQEIYDELRTSYSQFVNNDIAKIDVAREELANFIEDESSEINKQVKFTTDTIENAVSLARTDFTQAQDQYRDFADKINVSIDASKKDLSRLNVQSQLLREELEQKSQEVSAIYTQIQEYDSSLVELKDLYTQTSENIGKLKRDAHFVERTHKDLNVFAKRLSEYEQSLGNISTNFANLNKESINQLVEESRAKLDNLFAEFNLRVEQVDGNVDEFKKFTDDFLSKKDQIIIDSMNKLNVESLNVFEQADLKYSQFLQEINNKADNLYSELDVMLNKVEKDIENGNNNYQRLSEQINESTEMAGEKISDFFNKVNKNVHDKENEINSLFSRVESVKVDIDSRTEAIEKMYDKINTYNIMIDELNSLTQKTEEKLTYLQSESGFVNKVADKLKGVTKTVASLEKDIYDIQDQFSVENQERIDTLWNDAKNKIDNDVVYITNNISDLEKSVDDFEVFIKSLEIEQNSIRLKNETETKEVFEKLLYDINNKVKELSTDFDEKAKSIESSYQNNISQAVEDAENLKGEIFDNLKSDLKQKIGELDREYLARIKSIEQSMHEFEGAISYKFNRMDSIVSEVGVFEGVMRDYMDSETGKLKEELLSFEKELELHRNEEVKKAEEVYKEFGNGVARLETDLDDLKKRAYDNVSGKLAVLEDDFFTDIRTRSDKMEERIAEWQNHIALKMNEVSNQVIEERQELEANYVESFAAKLKELQGDIASESERIDVQVQRLSNLIDQRFTNAEQEVVRQREFIDIAIDEFKESSLKHFETEFNEHNGKINTEFLNYENKIKDQFVSVSEKIDVQNDELVRMLDAAKSDMTIWQSKVLQQISESNSEVNAKISDLKLQASDNIFEIQSEFQREKEYYLKEVTQQRNNIVNELETIGVNIHKLESDLTYKIANALDEFENKYTDVLERQTSQSEAILSSIVDENESFRKMASETRLKVNAVREQMLERVEEKANLLSVNLNEIDKRMKGFIEQTKIFEKADALKSRLKQDLDFLRDEIERLRKDKKDLKETDKNFQKMKKMEAELNSRINELLSQRIKVDEMEKDFTRLLETSNSISAKLDDVTSGSDILLNIQAKLRQVDEIIAEVDRKYVRLEHKEGLIDSTAKGVDKNFQQMEAMENRIKQIEGNFSQFLINLKSSSDRITVLAKNKEDADKAIEKIGSLDNLLNDIDNRMEAMQKARVWLADTETRLDQINKSAKENVKLFKTLVESDSAKEASLKASQGDIREMVKKLAHQGWSIQEIAKTTKISRGEVELILELTSDK